MNVQASASFRLGVRDFAVAFGETELSDYVAARIKAFEFAYRPLRPQERDGWLCKIAKTLTDDGLDHSGEHRLSAWERGWSEHINGPLVPKYFGKYPVVRWRGELIAPRDQNFEYEALGVIKDWLFDKHLRDVEAVYEFGCGTGHNLINAHRVNPQAMLCGLDWTRASQKLIEANSVELFDGKAYGEHFDFFKPQEKSQARLYRNCGVFTVAALEQTGRAFGPFIDWLIASRPGIVIHIEPIDELLDPSNLMDFLSLAYSRKRRYLAGLLDYLTGRDEVEIVTARRTSVGSLFLDGYSVIVWRPK